MFAFDNQTMIWIVIVVMVVGYVGNIFFVFLSGWNYVISTYQIPYDSKKLSFRWVSCQFKVAGMKSSNYYCSLGYSEQGLYMKLLGFGKMVFIPKEHIKICKKDSHTQFISNSLWTDFDPDIIIDDRVFIRFSGLTVNGESFYSQVKKTWKD